MFLVKILLFILLLLNNNKTIYKKEYCYYKVKPTLNISRAKLIDNRVYDILATINIDKINIINKPIYKLNSKYNNINQNITLLEGSIMPDNDNSIMFIASHSGYGEIAYFKNLYKLNIDDNITINYKNIDYTYTIINIYESNKSGNIVINKRYNKELILTTCSYNNNKQLIVEAIIKD